MLEILQFVFANIWHFLGTAILLCIVGNAAVEIVRAIGDAIWSARL